MITKHKTPNDLAIHLYNYLSKKKNYSPPLEIITEVINVLFFSSLRTEELQAILCDVIYLDPENPDPMPPGRIVKDRWSWINFQKKVPFTVSNLVKAAKASDPRTSSFAIYHDNKKNIFIWGIIDQGNRYHEYLHYDCDEGPERPGIFQATIVSIGHVIAYRGFTKIAELNNSNLVTTSHDVLRRGPIRELLDLGISRYVKNIKNKIPDDIFGLRPHWENSLREDWVSTICRLLLRIRNYKHGGSVIITPDIKCQEINIKYRINYTRLRDALFSKGITNINHTHSSDLIFEIMEDGGQSVPTELYLDETVFRNDLEEIQREIDGCIWFMSLMSRVDGALILTQDLEVLGFGGEILCSEAPPDVFLATNAAATSVGLKKADYQHFGTRHRSMMKYCYKYHGSIGFIISQDGDVRVMTYMDNKIIMWENIRLRLDTFVKPLRKKLKSRNEE